MIIPPSHWTNFPGFRMLSGSNAFLMASMVESADGLSFFRNGALVIPMPCSPVTVPPRAMTTSYISLTVLSARLQESSEQGSTRSFVCRLPSAACP